MREFVILTDSCCSFSEEEVKEFAEQYNAKYSEIQTAILNDASLFFLYKSIWYERSLL